MDSFTIQISTPDCNDEIREQIQERVEEAIDQALNSINQRFGTQAERLS